MEAQKNIENLQQQINTLIEKSNSNSLAIQELSIALEEVITSLSLSIRSQQLLLQDFDNFAKNKLFNGLN